MGAAVQPVDDPACDPTTPRRFSIWRYNRDRSAADREATLLDRKSSILPIRRRWPTREPSKRPKNCSGARRVKSFGSNARGRQATGGDRNEQLLSRFQSDVSSSGVGECSAPVVFVIGFVLTTLESTDEPRKLKDPWIYFATRISRSKQSQCSSISTILLNFIHRRKLYRKDCRPIEQ